MPFHKSLTLWLAISLAACAPDAHNSDALSELSPDAHSSVAAAISKPLGLAFSAETPEAYDDIIAKLEKASLVPNEKLSAQLALFYVLTKKNKWEQASQAQQYIQPRKSELTHFESLWFDALSARLSDDGDEEIARWKTVLELVPNNRWAWYELATPYYRQEDYANVVRALERALAIEPDPEKWRASYIHYLHSKSYFRIDEYEKSSQAALPALAYEKRRRTAQYRKVMADTASGKLQDPYQGLKRYREYSMKNGLINEAVHNANLSLFFFELGDYDRAVTHARQSYELQKFTYSAFVLGYSLTEKGELEEAQSVLKDAAAQFPENANLWGARGWLHHRLEEDEKALEFLMKARALNPRKHSAIERDIKIVTASLEGTLKIKVKPVRWYGD